MKLPKISIVTPTLNVEAVIETALLSVANQKYKEIEHLIIDGNSNDNTISIIKDYQKRYKHIKIIQEEDKGIYDAMNKGINLYKGNWLYFLGADDELYDENVLSDLHSQGAFSQDNIIYGNVYIKGNAKWAKDSTIYDGPFDLKKILLKNISHQAIFYPRSIVDEMGYYNIEYDVTADWDYNLRCYAKHKFLYFNRTIANFATGGKSSQMELDISVLRFAGNIIDYFNLDPENQEYYKPKSPFYDLFSKYKGVLKTHMNPFTDKISKGISLFTAIKNREETFEEALQTWVVHDQINEIIIVDWSSDNSLLDIVNKYQNGKILLVTVKEQVSWVLSLAFNVAARFTSNDKILKIDADVNVLPGFFEKHTLEPGKFFAGDWRKARNSNETHLNGNAYLYREDFFRVNGYNEFFKTYGWDDTDFFARLEAIGLDRKCFNFDTLHHIEHSGRMAFQSPSKKISNLTDEEWSRINIFINRFVAKKLDSWSGNNSMLDFKINIVNDHLISCKQSGNDINTIPDNLIKQGEIVAVKERLEELGLIIPEKIAELADDNDYIELYNLFLLKGDSISSNNLFTMFTNLVKLYKATDNEKNQAIKSINQVVNQKDQIILEKDQDIQMKNKIIQDKDGLILQNEHKIQEISKLIAQKEKIILERDQTVQMKNILLEERDEIIEQKVKDIETKSKLIYQKDKELLETKKLFEIKEQSLKKKTQEALSNTEVIKDREKAILMRDQLIIENFNLIQMRDQLLMQNYLNKKD